MKNYFVSMYQVLKLIEYCSYQEKFDYSFFEENTFMKKAYNTLKEIKDWIPGI